MENIVDLFWLLVCLPLEAFSAQREILIRKY